MFSKSSSNTRRSTGSRHAAVRRTPVAQSLEARQMMAADAIHVGVVFIETDYLEVGQDVGGDSQGDRFILSFTGGAEDTELSELRIRTDKDDDGISVGDPIFDTQPGGRGKDGSHPFQIVRVITSDGREVDARAEVEDGGQELVLRFTNFQAGDRLEFTLDVDEVLRNAVDLEVFNDRLDVITSGQEFQDSILEATFNAPHYETAHADAVFENDFGDPAADTGLNLPPDDSDDPDSRPNRSAAAVATTDQTPKPIDIAGNVFIDSNLDLVRQATELPIAGNELSLFRENESGEYVDTGLRTTTDADGSYRFSKSLGLLPGIYRVVQTQPDGLFSVGSVIGRVDGQVTGTNAVENILSDINIPLGDTSAVGYDFAEAAPASIRGFVYEDLDVDGIRDANENGIAGVSVRLVPINTIAPQSSLTVSTSGDGSYSFTGLAPGIYEVIEVNQPAGYTDGGDSAGTINGRVVGVADEPGDAIRQISLGGGDAGIEYNFGEWPEGSISGRVHLAAPGQDCDEAFDGDDTPLPGVTIILQDAFGAFVAQTTTNETGQYRFDGVPVGQYTIIEQTPAGLIDGSAHPGRVGGVTVGRANGPSSITSLSLTPGADAVEYNFCEAAPATLSGFVYVDDSNDGIRDEDEDAIAGVEITLIDAAGSAVGTTTTDQTGRYEFTGLLPGTYTIVESQPENFFDGIDTVGQVAGLSVGRRAGNDRLGDVTIKQGQSGSQYNFGELRPASLSGRVHVDEDGDCLYDDNEQPLEGVTITLLDDSGNQVAQTQTDANGRYTFEGLAPGEYIVVESQPDGLFDGGANVGSAGGEIVDPNRIGRIVLASGEVAVDYDFCEDPPAEISGTVFADGNGDCLIHPGERGLSGVTVELYGAGNVFLATTTTDADGNYRFTQLPAGEYTIREIQPLGFLQGGQMAGSGGGDDSLDDTISEISLGFGDRLISYNFCEIEPASIGGSVYVDADGDRVHDPDEDPIEGVTITLADATGQIIATTLTDAQGNYQFDNLAPGEYSITESQPEGFFQGGESVGTGDGWVIGRDQLGVRLGAGDTLVNYDFCELPPAAIAGLVYSETDLNRLFDPGDQPIPGVVIQLIDDTNQVVNQTTTNAQGRYEFTDLAPGVYSVRETQPSGLFHGGQVAGSAGGDAGQEDLIVGIDLRGGISATDYNFPEVPPAVISGYIFQDGDAISSASEIDPTDLREFRDGIRTTDDTPLSGVRVELRNVLGQPFESSRALPGSYDSDTIFVTTDASGYYEFTGLRPGAYHVYQDQPDSFIDGLDTPGTTGGAAVNPADVADDATQIVIQTLSASADTDPNNDAILNVSLSPGGRSDDNNFSEIVIAFTPDTPITQIEDNPRVIERVLSPIETFDPRIRLVSFAAPEGLRTPTQFYDEWAVTWHLSVINGGFPDGVNQERGTVRNVGFKTNIQDEGEWSAHHNVGRWSMYDQDGKPIRRSDSLMLGDEDAIALAGDFDGDGKDESVIYVGGDWYIDFDGDGSWDDGDLWIRLGTKMDRPVVGDWDGDGKDDVGIFGRQWDRDPDRIKRDPGLPDPANERRRYVEATTQNEVARNEHTSERLLRRGEDGALKADAVDHVFKYGEQTDTPLSGDWNGDGIDQIAVFRGGRWMLDADGDGRWTDRDEKAKFGRPGDEPIVGDFDGDGIDDIGVVRGDVWIIDTDGDRRITGNDRQIEIPRGADGGDQPIVGDFDGDGIDDVGYYRPAS